MVELDSVLSFPTEKRRFFAINKGNYFCKGTIVSDQPASNIRSKFLRTKFGLLDAEKYLLPVNRNYWQLVRQ
jgi:hypothetical protein